MVRLESFGEDLTIAIVGSSGGIGSGLAHILNEHPQVARLYEFNRSERPPTGAKCISKIVDITDESSLSTAAHGIEKPLDLVLVTTGVLHTDQLKPEKAWRDFSMANAEEVFKINALAPMLVAKYFLPLLGRERKSVFAVLSAKVGSISDNELGGWYSYRASKAALNQYIKSASIELKRKNKQAMCIALHPGTVATDLSKPYQGNVKSSQLFTPEKAAHQLLHVVNTAPLEQTGALIAWDGSVIAP